MKKEMNSKVLIAGGIGAIAVAMVGTVFFITSDVGKMPTSNQEEPVAVVADAKKEKAPEDKDETQVERIMTPYVDNITPVGYGDKEFPLEQSASFKEKMLRLAEGGEVSTMLTEMESKLESYRFSQGVNLEIAGLYADASLVNGLIGKTEDEMRKTLVGAFKTPEMLALMPLYLPELARRDIIHDSLSLTPLTEGPWKIHDTKFITNREDADNDEAYQENGVAISMFNVVEGIHQIHVIEMNRVEEPDIPVRAYISELANGDLELYGFYIPDGTTHYYQTVEFFEKLDEEYLVPNEEYQHEQMQEEIDKGNIPDELMDEFLNPTE